MKARKILKMLEKLFTGTCLLVSAGFFYFTFGSPEPGPFIDYLRNGSIATALVLAAITALPEVEKRFFHGRYLAGFLVRIVGISFLFSIGWLHFLLPWNLYYGFQDLLCLDPCYRPYTLKENLQNILIEVRRYFGIW